MFREEDNVGKDVRQLWIAELDLYLVLQRVNAFCKTALDMDETEFDDAADELVKALLDLVETCSPAFDVLYTGAVRSLANDVDALCGPRSLERLAKTASSKFWSLKKSAAEGLVVPRFEALVWETAVRAVRSGLLSRPALDKRFEPLRQKAYDIVDIVHPSSCGEACLAVIDQAVDALWDGDEGRGVACLDPAVVKALQSKKHSKNKKLSRKGKKDGSGSKAKRVNKSLLKLSQL